MYSDKEVARRVNWYTTVRLCPRVSPASVRGPTSTRNPGGVLISRLAAREVLFRILYPLPVYEEALVQTDEECHPMICNFFGPRHVKIPWVRDSPACAHVMRIKGAHSCPTNA